MINKYPMLFSPLKIGGLTLKNRLEAAPTSLEDFTEREYTPHGWIEYHANRATGGVAVVTVGETPVISTTGPTQHHMLTIDDPDIMPYLAKVADAIHQQGACASIELCHGGAAAMKMFLHGNTAISPSGQDGPFDGEKTIKMTEEMIQEVITVFGAAAYRAKLCGFDMCMLHAGHGWLLGQFLSPLTNHRDDQWGGSPENCIRILLEIIREIRKQCGEEFPIEVRISGTEDCEGGYDLDAGVNYCKLLDGKCDLLHISIGSVNGYSPNGGSTITSPSYYEKRGRNAYLAAAVKKAVIQTPVVAIGSLVEPEMMEKILENGEADMIACARTFIADPEFPRKVMRGREDEVRPCLRCIGCLDDTMVGPQIIRCAVNPEIGREIEYKCYRYRPQEKRRVLIVGGGPAGVQAALTASDQGHEVILCEKQDELGGALRCNTDIPFKDDMERYRQWMIRMVGRARIDVRLNTEVTSALMESVDPDVVICAIGAEAKIPPIPGIDGDQVILATDVHRQLNKLGDRIVLIGAGLVGCETAIWLSMLGKQVTIVEMADSIMASEYLAPDEGDMTCLFEFTTVQLNKWKVDMAFGQHVTEINHKGLVTVDENGEQRLYSADNVVIAAGMKPREKEREALRAVTPCEFKTVGDCNKVGRVKDATASGYAAGYYIY